MENIPRQTLNTAVVFGWALMAVGMFFFESIPAQMLGVFTSDKLVVEIGRIGFRLIGASFLPMVTSLIFPVFFQAVGFGLKSSILTLVRTVVLFVPLGFVFSRWGLNQFWLTFPVTELLTTLLGFVFYRQFLNNPYVKEAPLIDKTCNETVIQHSEPGIIITIARQHGSSGKEIGRMVAKLFTIKR